MPSEFRGGRRHPMHPSPGCKSVDFVAGRRFRRSPRICMLGLDEPRVRMLDCAARALPRRRCRAGVATRSALAKPGVNTPGPERASFATSGESALSRSQRASGPGCAPRALETCRTFVLPHGAHAFACGAWLVHLRVANDASCVLRTRLPSLRKSLDCRSGFAQQPRGGARSWVRRTSR